MIDTLSINSLAKKYLQTDALIKSHGVIKQIKLEIKLGVVMLILKPEELPMIDLFALMKG